MVAEAERVYGTETACARPCCTLTDEDLLDWAGLDVLRWSRSERLILGALLRSQGRWVDLLAALDNNDAAMIPNGDALRTTLWRVRTRLPQPWCIDTATGVGVHRLHDGSATCHGRRPGTGGRARVVTAAEAEQARALRAEGLMWREIGARLGHPHATISQAVRTGRVLP